MRKKLALQFVSSADIADLGLLVGGKCTVLPAYKNLVEHLCGL
jgi:hypothetical protein